MHACSRPVHIHLYYWYTMYLLCQQCTDCVISLLSLPVPTYTHTSCDNNSCACVPKLHVSSVLGCVRYIVVVALCGILFCAGFEQLCMSVLPPQPRDEKWHWLSVEGLMTLPM